MGQRLVIHMFDKGKEIANAYYHWSAYTDDAIYTVKKMLNSYEQLKKENPDKRLLAIRLLEKTGAGFPNADMVGAKEVYPNETFAISNDRNEGLIAISEDSMEESSRWEEGRVDIYLDSETIEFNVWFGGDDNEYVMEVLIEQYIKDIEDISEERYKEISKKVLNNIENIPFEEDIHKVPINKFAKFADIVLEADNNMMINGNIYIKIA